MLPIPDLTRTISGLIERISTAVDNDLLQFQDKVSNAFIRL